MNQFSNAPEDYFTFRPVYPEALYEFIFSHVKEKELAWDAGTGNGQAATALSKHFKKVFATDISAEQLAHAKPAKNIRYCLEPAEKTGLAGHSVDLITIAQALHWFRFEEFYREAGRVSKPGAVIAAWTYSLLKTGTLLDNLLEEFHYEYLKDYWDDQRKYVNDGYESIPFPFQKIRSALFYIDVKWSIVQMEGYLKTWSAVKNYRDKNNMDPVGSIMKEIRSKWGEEFLDIRFPVHLKLGLVS